MSDPDRRIFALSFHVDYWNRLGWVDPFSQKIFSERQRRYARVLKDNRVYTPELVVNGQDGFVGSDRRRAKLRIDQALQQVPEVSLTLTHQIPPPKGRLQVAYQVVNVPLDAILNVALVEKHRTVDVPRGENAGRQLAHHHIVREFVSIKADSNGTVRLKMPKELVADDMAVIGFVQHKKTMQIVAANRSVLEK